MRTALNQLHERLGITTVYAIHDQVEAMTLGDRVCVLRDGKLPQVDTPQRLFDAPVNLFVAGFIGSPAMNFVLADFVARSTSSSRSTRRRSSTPAWPARPSTTTRKTTPSRRWPAASRCGQRGSPPVEGAPRAAPRTRRRHPSAALLRTQPAGDHRPPAHRGRRSQRTRPDEVARNNLGNRPCRLLAFPSAQETRAWGPGVRSTASTHGFFLVGQSRPAVRRRGSARRRPRSVLSFLS